MTKEVTKEKAKEVDSKVPQPQNVFGMTPGMLNPGALIEGPDALPDPRNQSSTYVSLLKKQSKDYVQASRKQNSPFYRAIVLSVTVEELGTENKAPYSSIVSNLYQSNLIKSKDPLKAVIVHARIPELHQMRPIPKDPSDIDSIQLYPTFETIDNIAGNETYEVGDIVNVTFQDIENQRSGVLLGPIVRAIPQNVTNITCNATYLASPGGQALGTTPKIVTGKH